MVSHGPSPPLARRSAKFVLHLLGHSETFFAAEDVEAVVNYFNVKDQDFVVFRMGEGFFLWLCDFIIFKNV